MRIFLSSDCLTVPAPLQKRTDITWIRPSLQGTIPDAHLYIWDYSGDIDIQLYVLEHRSAQHLVVTDAKRLDTIGNLQSSLCILLKPVSPFTLKAFVELALKNWEIHRNARELAILKLDRDTLLQYVLEVNLKLQEYDRKRSNFLARALHDFRTPLTALDGYCGLIADGRLGQVSPTQSELLNRMRHSTKRLARLADGALDVLLQGCLEKNAERREWDITEILKRALHDVFPCMQEKGIRLETRMAPPERVLLLEPEKIQQVFVNLLENSCKFTPRNGHIQICGYSVCEAADCERENSEAALRAGLATAYRIDISDSGPGVPADLAEDIFEEYASFLGGSDRSGGGLGLAICKAVIAAHGGSIWATPSNDSGRFSFVLPFAAAAEQTADDSVSVDRCDTASVEAIGSGHDYGSCCG